MRFPRKAVMLQSKTVWRGNSPVAVHRDLVLREVVDLVLENVHPSNLGPLPPSLPFLVSKAVQIGLIADLSEAVVPVTVWHCDWDAEQDARNLARVRSSYYGI